MSFDIEQVILCPVCKIEFGLPELYEPRTLVQCGHSVCRPCLRRMLSRAIVLMGCPKCGKMPMEGIPLTMESFPINHILMDILREEKERVDFVDTVRCINPHMPCAENEDHVSTVHCLNCNGDYCDYCFKKVHDFKLLRCHQSVPISKKPWKAMSARFERKFYCKECKVEFSEDSSSTHQEHSFQLREELIKENQNKLKSSLSKIAADHTSLKAIIEEQDQLKLQIPVAIKTMKAQLDADIRIKRKMAFKRLNELIPKIGMVIEAKKKKASETLEEMDECMSTMKTALAPGTVPLKVDHMIEDLPTIPEDLTTPIVLPTVSATVHVNSNHFADLLTPPH